MHGDVHVTCYACESWRTPCSSHGPSSSTWVLGIELKSWGIATHALSSQAIPASLHGASFQINHIIHWALTHVSSGIETLKLRHVLFIFALKYFTVTKMIETKTQILHPPAFWCYTVIRHCGFQCFPWDNNHKGMSVPPASFSFPPLSGGATLLMSVFSHCARKGGSLKTMWHSFVELSQCVASA